MYHKALAVLAATMLASSPAFATDFSFTGNFTQDDNVQLFNFTVGAPSSVTLRTWSYAGGVNAQGQSIARGGFDPILALFDSAGNLISQNDDGGCGNVSQDLSGQCYDTFLTTLLGAGDYTVAVMQYDNFANGPNLSDGFENDGTGNFTSAFSCGAAQTSFRDVSGGSFCGRDNHWAFDILNVAEAVVVGNGVPEPSTWAMMLLGFGAIGASMRIRRRKEAVVPV